MFVVAKRKPSDLPEVLIVFRRVARLRIDGDSAVESVHAGGINWLDLENTEHRYLLAGAYDGSVAVYDTLATVGCQQERAAVLHLDRNSPGGHKYSVSCVSWYPVDNGLFVTGSYDTDVKVKLYRKATALNTYDMN